MRFIVPAAGLGQRMGAPIPKQFLSLCGKPVLQHTLERLLSLDPIQLVLVVPVGDESWREVPATQRCDIARGGETRAHSVLNGLNALDCSSEDWVLVHDGVRACVTADNIRHLALQVADHPTGGLLAAEVTDTVKQIDASGQIAATLDRGRIALAQTPQMFRYGVLKSALQTAIEQNLPITDEASAVEALGLTSLWVKGRSDNIKITRPEDLALAEYYLRQQEAEVA